VTTEALRSWNDEDEATEQGAAGIATLLANLELCLEVILRSRKRTGFDYWLGDRRIETLSEAEQGATAGLAELLLDDHLVVRARMEVSGIRNGNDRRITARVKEKLDQVTASDYLQIPAYVVVVEFGRPIAEVRRK
jgi:DICT domain-containing protein